MKRIFFIAILFGVFAVSGYSQTGKVKPPGDSTWVYFELKGTITVKILEHRPDVFDCGVRAFASMTIAKTEQDTIRILDLCNKNDYKVGEIVKVAPETTPSFQVTLPLYYIADDNSVVKRKHRSKADKKSDPPVANVFYMAISKTTWGHIIESK